MAYPYSLRLRSSFATLVADETDLVGMHEVVAMSEVYLFIFKFHPNHFFHQLVAPPLHDLKRSIKLTVQDPKEDEAFIREEVQRNAGDFAVGHSVILKGEFAVGKHELGVILLGSLDAPGWVNEHHFKLTNLLCKQLPVEVADIAVDVTLAKHSPSTLLRIVHQL